MTKLQRIRTVLSALVMFLCCGVIVRWPDEGFFLILAIVCVSTLVRGLSALVYYVTMAKHMVGGKLQLYKGIILMDIGLFFTTLEDVPTIYLVLYLAIGNLLAGVINILHALETRKMESGAWKLNMTASLVNIISGIACLLCVSIQLVPVYIYAAGLFYTACLRIVSAFRRSAIVYIS